MKFLFPTISQFMFVQQNFSSMQLFISCLV